MLQVRCAAHILQLCLKTPAESCDKLERTLNRISEIVRNSRMSTATAEVVENEFGAKSLRQRTAVRWNSSFPMAQRALEFDWANSEIPERLRPSPGQLGVLQEFVDVMEPFQEAFKQFQRNDYPVVCCVIPVIGQLKRSLEVSASKKHGFTGRI